MHITHGSRSCDTHCVIRIDNSVIHDPIAANSAPISLPYLDRRGLFRYREDPLLQIAIFGTLENQRDDALLFNKRFSKRNR